MDALTLSISSNSLIHSNCSGDTLLGDAQSFPFLNLTLWRFNSMWPKLFLFKMISKSGNHGDTHILFFLAIMMMMFFVPFWPLSLPMWVNLYHLFFNHLANSSASQFSFGTVAIILILENELLPCTVHCHSLQCVSHGQNDHQGVYRPVFVSSCLFSIEDQTMHVWPSSSFSTLCWPMYPMAPLYCCGIPHRHHNPCTNNICETFQNSCHISFCCLTKWPPCHNKGTWLVVIMWANLLVIQKWSAHCSPLQHPALFPMLCPNSILLFMKKILLFAYVFCPLSSSLEI